MRMLRILMVLGSCLWVTHAMAQARVQSGEHEAFSRLVVYLPASQAWELTPSESGYVLTVQNWNDGFNTSEVFNLIPRTRIFAVEASDSEIEIQLACDCVANAEPLDRGGVIIDVSASELPTAEIVEATLIVEAPAIAPIEQPNLVQSAPPAEVVLPDRIERVDIPIPVFEAAEDQPKSDQALEQFKQSLLEDIGRSASLSLIELNPNRSIPSKPEHISSEKQNPALSELQQFSRSGRIRVTSALEAAIDDDRLRPARPKAENCPNPERFAISRWASELPFTEQLGPMRNAVLGEFDTPQPNAGRDLARFYLHFGLGAEARAVIGQFEVSAAERETITALSQLFDPMMDQPLGPLTGYLKCAASISVWAVLQGADTRAMAEAQLREIVAEFSSWPTHLRSALGPKLAEQLLKHGHDESAGVIGNIVKRPDDGPDSEMLMVSARQTGLQPIETNDIKDIISQGNEDAPEALNIYLNRVMDEGQQVDPTMLGLAEAYAKELDTLPIGNDLRNTRLRALTHSKQYAAALVDLKSAERGVYQLDLTLMPTVVSKFLDGAPSDLVARLAIHVLEYEQLTQISPELAQSFAKRLLDNGLPELSARLLTNAPVSDGTTLLNAQIARSLGNPDSANEILQQLGNAEANAMRASLLLASGRADQAWSELSGQLPAELTAQVAWAAAEWENVTDGGAAGRVAGLLAQPVESNLQSAPLTTARTLATSSRETRAALAELLNTPIR